MNILILSRRERYYSTRRLVEVSRRLGHSAKVINPLKYVLTTRKSSENPDVVIPRIGNVAIEYSLAMVKDFELMGVPVLNNSDSIYLAKDKFVSLQVLKSNKVPVPETFMVRSKSLVKKAVKQLGGLPVVLKLLRGSQGIGVKLAQNITELINFAESTWTLDHDFIVQKYYPESRGQDTRILVIGNNVIAGMRRYPRKGDFRSNIHQGGWSEKVNLPRSYQTLAKRAAKAIGLQIAGVDIIESKNGPLIIEVNASPGFEGLEKVTGQDIAKVIIDFACAMARNRRKR